MKLEINRQTLFEVSTRRALADLRQRIERLTSQWGSSGRAWEHLKVRVEEAVNHTRLHSLDGGHSAAKIWETESGAQIDNRLNVRAHIATLEHDDHPLAGEARGMYKTPVTVITEGPHGSDLSIYARGGDRRYYIECHVGNITERHDISSDESITSLERLEAHAEGLLEGTVKKYLELEAEQLRIVLGGPVGIRRDKHSYLADTVGGPHPLGPELDYGTLSSHQIRTAVEIAKMAMQADYSACWQILAINDKGERITGEPIAYQRKGSNPPSLKLIHDLMALHPEAVELVIEGMGMVFAESGNAIERREHAEPNGEWWQVSIKRTPQYS